MRVAIDVGPVHGARTGVGNAVAWTVDALSRRPIELVRYVLSARAATGPDERRLPLPAAVAHRVWSHADRPRLDRWLGGADLIHGTNYVVPPSRRPRLVSVYDCWFLRPDTDPASVHPDVRRAGRVLVRSLATGAHAICSSRATADVLIDLTGTPHDHVHVVHLGPPPVPQGARPDRAPSDSPYVVAIGTLERRKNLTILVEAFGRVAADFTDARLVLAGAPGDAATDVAAAISALPSAIASRIERPGRVDEDAKANLLAGATAVAYPSIDEGFGFPVLEAQQLGVPVVATTAGSVPEIAGGGARYADPRDVDAWARELHGVLSASTIDLVDAGRRNVERFSWDRTAAELVELYTTIGART